MTDVTTERGLKAPLRVIDRIERALRGRGHTALLSGMPASARGHLVAALRRRGGSPLVCVTADESGAERLADELELFLGTSTGEAPPVLRLPDEPVSPYELPASNHRGRALERLATLARLAGGGPFDALVVSATGLARRQSLPGRSGRAVTTLSRGDFLDRDALLLDLEALGFDRVPLVESPGTFAARGAILDVFPPLQERPMRLEFFGDELESIRAFDPESQRAFAEIATLQLSPAREFVLSPAALASGIAALREAADAISMPSPDLRELIDEVEQGRLPPGLSGVLPGFCEGGLASLFDVLRGLAPPPVFFVDEPREVEAALEAHEAALGRAFEEARERGELAMPPEAHFLTAQEVRRSLGDFRAILSHGLYVGDPGRRPIRSALLKSTAPAESAFERPESEAGQASLSETAAPARAQLESAFRKQRSREGADGELDGWMERFAQWRELGLYTAIAVGTRLQAEKLSRVFAARGLAVRIESGPLPSAPVREAEPDALLHFHLGALESGFVDVEEGLALVAEAELPGHHRAPRARPRRAARTDKPFVEAFQRLDVGDLVVHADYGIGRYQGLTRLTLGGMTCDVMVIQYAGSDRVYLPTLRLRLVQKFTGAGADSVALDRLGSMTWEKRKRAVKEQLLKMAAELLRLEAARKAHPGFAFHDDPAAFERFEAGFAHEETPDQARAIADVLADMRAPRPMDRLVCGDVGFGKTEVALRAAFQAVNDGKQVAVLVPTTLLAAQHLETFRARFTSEPVRVEMLSRLRSPRENREVLDGLARGAVDIVIGTHRLLGSDVAFADLGLIVIDEEHRFGVAHKEKLKRFRNQVDVLTLTATPIPRTLNLSLSGLREMSLIASPPSDRKAIRTFVLKFDPARVAEAIRFELGRGGQVYFVHNRVETIEDARHRLSALVPEARIGVAHGQMPQGALEKVMADFAGHRLDVVVCSSIIESGLDIPAANTIVVDRADTFGLAQLYQIRGRVGRSSERAYGYLLVPARQPLQRDAARRLEVLQSFTELGAGFHVAARDLDIRGAGNLLGKDQSGQIAAVGFDLYCELLEQAVGELRGEPPRETCDPEVNLPIPAYLPETYLPDLSLRLTFYKRLADALSEAELDALREEMRDRFGEPPLEVDQLVALMELKVRLRRLRLRALESGPRRLSIALGPDADLDPRALAQFVQGAPSSRRLTPEMKLVVTFDRPRERPEEVIAECHALLDLLEELRPAGVLSGQSGR